MALIASEVIIIVLLVLANGVFALAEAAMVAVFDLTLLSVVAGEMGQKRLVLNNPSGVARTGCCSWRKTPRSPVRLLRAVSGVPPSISHE